VNGAEVIGVYREERFSPGKVGDDRAILDLTADALVRAGHAVRRLAPEELPRLEKAPAVVFAMCQGEEALAWLDRVQVRSTVVNSPEAIRGCYRMNLVERLDRVALPQPRWALAGEALPANLGPGPWLKRGDVHAMEASDVRRVFSARQWKSVMADFHRRGIRRAIVQQHLEGTVYKFYGVRGGFFRAYGLPESLVGAASELARRAADAVGLEVYGGDGVASRDGSLALIDVNDWPSFSRCRAEAAEAIARRLHQLVAAGVPG
jgi:hypothetical protein